MTCCYCCRFSDLLYIIAYIGYQQPEKTALYGGRSRLWSAEQGEENKKITPEQGKENNKRKSDERGKEN